MLICVISIKKQALFVMSITSESVPGTNMWIQCLAQGYNGNLWSSSNFENDRSLTS